MPQTQLPPIPLSHSRLEDVKCLYKFKRKHVDRPGLKEPRNDWLMFGSLFHHVADVYQRRLAADPRVKTKPMVDPALLSSVFLEEWKQRDQETVSLGEEHFETLHQLLQAWAQRYPVGPTFVSSESSIALDENWKPCDWKSKSARYRMKIDRVEVDGSVVTILDWKTSWKADTEAEVKASPQLYGYAMGAAALLPEAQIIRVGMVWPRSGIEWVVEVDRADFEKVKNRILRESDRIERARAKNQWEAIPGPQCDYCPAWHECPIKDIAQAYRAPETADQAKELLGYFPMLKRQMNELAGQLQAYVKMHGAVGIEGLVAEYRTSHPTVYDRQELIEALTDIGVEPQKYMQFNTKALKKDAKKSPEIMEALEDAAGPGPAKQRWFVGKPSIGEDEEEVE